MPARVVSTTTNTDTSTYSSVPRIQQQESLAKSGHPSLCHAGPHPQAASPPALAHRERRSGPTKEEIAGRAEGARAVRARLKCCDVGRGAGSSEGSGTSLAHARCSEVEPLLLASRYLRGGESGGTDAPRQSATRPRMLDVLLCATEMLARFRQHALQSPAHVVVPRVYCRTAC